MNDQSHDQSVQNNPADQLNISGLSAKQQHRNQKKEQKEKEKEEKRLQKEEDKLKKAERKRLSKKRV